MKKLIEERVKLHEDNKTQLDKAEAEGRTLSSEEQEQFDAREKRMAEIAATLERVAEHNNNERALAESMGQRVEPQRSDGPAGEPTEEESALALRAWALGRLATPEHVAAAQRCNVNVSSSELEIRTRIVMKDGRAQYRTLASATSTQGGASIPDELMRAYHEVQKWYGNVRSVAEVISTETGATLPWPTVDDTANTGEIIGESAAVTTTVDPLFGVINLGAYKFSSKAVIVPVELLQDSAINLSVYLGTALGRRIGRIQNTKFTVGAGTTEPAGIVTRSALGKTAAATNAFTSDEIIDLMHSVDIAYRTPSAGFMMHDLTAATCRKMKDTTGKYIWEMSMQLGQPDRLFGDPVSINNDMASTAVSGAKLMLYGDYSHYKVRDAGPVVMIRASEIFVLNHQVAFLAFQRSDGNLIDTTAVKHLKLG